MHLLLFSSPSMLINPTNRFNLQNFDSIPHVVPGREAYYGGSVSLADYCPYIQEFTWRSKNVVIRGSHCQYAENNPRTCIVLIAASGSGRRDASNLCIFNAFQIRIRISLWKFTERIHGVSIIPIRCGRNRRVIRLDSGSIGDRDVIGIGVIPEDCIYWWVDALKIRTGVRVW